MLIKKKIQKKPKTQLQTQDSDIEEPTNELEQQIQGSKTEFDKKLLSDPNNSQTWIEYVVFTLQNESLEAARKLIDRGLVVINFSRYTDKNNMWKCYINLEFNKGTPESLLNVVNKAANACDAQLMINHVLDLFIQSKKFEEGESYLKLILKKGKSKIDSWLKNSEYFLHWGKQTETNQEARVKDMNKRALQSLDRRDHITFLNRYAVLEYRFGNLINARTQFENIVTNFPKRADIW